MQQGKFDFVSKRVRVIELEYQEIEAQEMEDRELEERLKSEDFGSTVIGRIRKCYQRILGSRPLNNFR